MKTLSLSITLLVAACGGGESRVDHPTTNNNAPVTRCYAGPSQVHVLPANQHVGDGTLVARRTTDRARGTITEEVASSFPGQPARRFAVTMTVTGSKFVMTEKGGAFTGEGVLTGPAWAWTEWTSTSRLPDGTTVRSTDRAAADGFDAEKIVTGPDGVDRVRIVEHVTAFPCTEFDARIGAL